MLGLLLLLFAQAEIAPREATWKELGETVFDPAWILPDDLPLAPRESGLAVVLESELPRVAALVVEPSADDPDAPRCLGDLVVASRGLDRVALDALLARTARAQPELWRALEPYARQLLREERLEDPDWDPRKDAGNDGIVMARPLTLDGVERRPWSSQRGSRLLQQGAVLVRADLATIKAVENDFTRYPGRPGTSYESIDAVPGSYLRGLDPEGRPFAALRVRFESDLPFPFSTYDCDLRILNRIRADGLLECDIASPSRDFHWMAGRDLYVPVHASDGTWQAELVMRRFGFDLDDVPDGDDARAAGLRSSLGSLKREAQALQLAREVPESREDGVIPAFRVLTRER